MSTLYKSSENVSQKRRPGSQRERDMAARAAARPGRKPRTLYRHGVVRAESLTEADLDRLEARHSQGKLNTTENRS